MLSRSKKISFLGLFTTLGLLFGYIENLIVLPVKIPGIKLGISNIVTLVALYLFGPMYALIVMILKVLLTNILFGNGLGILYSVSGAVLSFAVMLILYRIKHFSIVGVSVAGGVFHNIGQIIIASLFVKSLSILYYLPVLVISGTLAGIIVGLVGKIIVNRLESFIRGKGI